MTFTVQIHTIWSGQIPPFCVMSVIVAYRRSRYSLAPVWWCTRLYINSNVNPPIWDDQTNWSTRHGIESDDVPRMVRVEWVSHVTFSRRLGETKCNFFFFFLNLTKKFLCKDLTKVSIQVSTCAAVWETNGSDKAIFDFGSERVALSKEKMQPWWHCEPLFSDSNFPLF